MSLPAIWPYALAATLLLAVVILGLLALLLKRSAKASEFVDADEPEEEAAAPSAAQEQLVADIPSAFRRAAKYIDRAADGDRKNVPLFLMVGDQGSRDSDMLANAGLELTWGAPEDAGTSLAEGRGFWVFDRGVVLDVAGDETGWDDVITQLQRLRPKRPVDGVIVTLSCAELLEAAGSELKRTDLAARAARTYRKLWDAQQRIGFRLPTYVLVTGCEKLTGFHALTGSLHQQSRRQIVGWSNPNGVEAVYRAGWVDEAFEALGRRLEDVVMEVFAEGTLEGDQLVRLTPSAASLAAGLRPTLDNLFKASAYHGSLIFRGLYFCGRESASILEDAPPAGPVSFLAEVLDRKVFIEHRLASPTARTVMARNRTVSIMKTAAAAVFLFSLASLAWAAYSFSAKNEVLLPVLTAAETAMVADSDNPVEMRKNAIALLNGLATIEFKRYESYVVPAGWFASFHGRLEHAFSDAFHDIVLRALRETLEARMTRLAAIEEGRVIVLPQPAPAVQPPASPAAMNFGIVPAGLNTEPIVPSATVGVVAVPMAGVDVSALGAEAAPPWTDAQVGTIASSREFIAMRDYAKKLEELDEHIRGFNRLRETNDLHQVGKLVKYAFDLDLPETFYKKDDLYKKAMRDASGYRPIDVDVAFREGTARKLNRLANEFHDSVFRRNAFEARLQRLSATIQNVTYQPPSAGDTTSLQSIFDQLKRVESDLSGPELEWAFSREFDFGADYNRMLDDISGTSYLGAPVAAQVRDATAARWKRFQQGLTWASSPLTKTILAVHADHPEMHLSKESLLLQSALQTFLDQSFVVARRTPGPIKTDLFPHHRLKWDQAALGQAVNVVQAYDRFRGSTLTLFPHDVRGSIDRVARERALGDMLEAIRVARQEEEVSYEIDPEEQLRADVASFSAMVPSLETVLEASSRLSPETGRQVAASMSAEAYRILRNVNNLLERENAYRTVDDLGQWDGERAPTPRYWAKADDAEVAGWLDATRARIAYLAMNYAKPQLNWLAKSRTPEPAHMRGLVAGWQAIVDDLRDHESKKPGNSIAVLEDYISVRMAKVTAADCSAAGLPSGFRGGRSFFAQTAQDLSRRVRTRCIDLAGLDATMRYAKVADYFNQRLARRYPFAENLTRREAVPADLRTFFRIFDEHKAVLTATAAKGGLGEEHKEQRAFIEEMAKVRALFPASFDAPKADIAPSLDVEATFRVLKSREIDDAGQQIIDWGVKVGSQQTTNRGPVKKMRWTVDQPVHISLRWADDGLRVPVIGSLQPEAQVETTRKVIWKYENTWSLFAALAAHPTRLEQLPEYDDVLPVTMTFDFSTKPANGPESDTRPARVFIRLALLAPGTNQPVELPHFPLPTHAPAIPGNAVTKEASR